MEYMRLVFSSSHTHTKPPGGDREQCREQWIQKYTSCHKCNKSDYFIVFYGQDI